MTSTMAAMTDVLCEFLEAAFHSILYARELYPMESFKCCKLYNIVVQMNTHPEVRKYIADLLVSLRSFLDSSSLHSAVFTIQSPEGASEERFVFEIQQFRQNGSEPKLWILEQNLRAFLLRLNACESLLPKRVKGSSWTVEIHTTQQAVASMQERQLVQDFMWFVAEDKQTSGGQVNLIPIKSVDIPLLKMQLYVETKSDSS